MEMDKCFLTNVKVNHLYCSTIKEDEEAVKLGFPSENGKQIWWGMSTDGERVKIEYFKDTLTIWVNSKEVMKRFGILDNGVMSEITNHMLDLSECKFETVEYVSEVQMLSVDHNGKLKSIPGFASAFVENVEGASSV